MDSRTAPLARADVNPTAAAERSRRGRRLGKLELVAIRLLSLLALFGAWEWYGRRSNPILFTYPTAIAQASVVLARQGVLTKALGQSLSVLGGGLLLSTVAGVAIGLAIGRSRIVEAVLQVPLDALYATPMVALVPVIVLWVGFGPVAKVIIVVLFSVFAIVLNTARGVREVDPQLIEVARSYLAREPGLWWHVVLPSALPYVLTGIRLAVGRALVGVVIAELYTSIAGLGFLLATYANTFQTAKVFVPVAILMLLGVTLTWLLQLAERWLAPWRHAEEGD